MYEIVQPGGYRTTFLNRITPLAEAINPHQAFSEGIGESQQRYSLHSDRTSFNRRISASLGVLNSINDGGECPEVAVRLDLKSQLHPYQYFFLYRSLFY